MSVNVDNSKLSRALIVPNKLGLHIRAAQRLHKTVSRYRAEVVVSRAEVSVDCKSVWEVLTLGAAQGDELVFHLAGEDAADALAAIEELFAANFHE